MFDTQHSKQPEHEQSQADSAPEASKTKQSTQPTGDLARIPLYTQLAWGNQPPSWLRLPMQRKEPHEEEPLQERDEPSTQRKENTTGLPDTLKAGVEQLSGLSMDDVQVHYNSSQPAQMQALAYTQGTEIHVGPGQEKHLAHEVWHVVQQKEGRVKPTMQLQGMAINNNAELEHEADVMPTRLVPGGNQPFPVQQSYSPRNTTIQRVPGLQKGQEVKVHTGGGEQPIISGTISEIIRSADYLYYQVLRDDNKALESFLEHVVYPDNMKDKAIHESNEQQVREAIAQEKEEDKREASIIPPVAKAAPPIPVAKAAPPIDEWKQFQKYESGNYAFRYLNEYDAAALGEKGGIIMAKGTGGTPQQHVALTKRTQYLSASRTMAGARKYQAGAVGAVVIDLTKVTVAYDCDALLEELTDEGNARGNAAKGRELLILKEIPQDAIVWQGKALPKDPDEYKKDRKTRGQGDKKKKGDPNENRYILLIKKEKNNKINKKEKQELQELKKIYGNT